MPYGRENEKEEIVAIVFDTDCRDYARLFGGIQSGCYSYTCTYEYTNSFGYTIAIAHSKPGAF